MPLTIDAGNFIGAGKPLVGFFDKGDGIAFLAATITFDSSYLTGGETLDLRPYFSTVTRVLIESSNVNTHTYDYTNRKVIATVAATGVEVANAVDLSAVTVGFIAWGVATLDKV